MHAKPRGQRLGLNHTPFESLVRSYYQPLYRYAFWICKNPTIAEDLVQETFSRAWKSFAQLKDAQSAKAWLYTILTRENARRFERKSLPMADVDQDWQFEAIADPHDPIEEMALKRAIFQLPEHFRQPLALQLLGGLSTDEIASVLELNSNTVSTRLFRAKAQLKSQLTETMTEDRHHG